MDCECSFEVLIYRFTNEFGIHTVCLELVSESPNTANSRRENELVECQEVKQNEVSLVIFAAYILITWVILAALPLLQDPHPTYIYI